MKIYSDFKDVRFFLFILIIVLVFAGATYSLHTQGTSLSISGTSVSNWTDSNTTGLYTFTISTNEPINKTTIDIPSSFALNESTINSSEYPSWTCANTSGTVIECNAALQNATSSISVWFNATSPTITDETIYTWHINTTDLNGTINSTTLTTGVDGKAPQIGSQNTTYAAELNATQSSYAFLKVNVSDANIDSVKINLSSVGLSNETVMHDDGANGDDENASDSIYSYNISGNVLYTSGLKTLNLNLTDKLGNYNDTQYISLTIYDITNPGVILTADQYTVNASGTDEIKFYAAVTETELNNVTINLTELGGSGTRQMYNDGTHGDENSSDNIWTYNMTIPVTFHDGDYDVSVNATDNSSNCNGTQSRTITVVDVTAPYVTAMTAIPSTVPANGTNVTFTVNITDLEGLKETIQYRDDVFIDLSSVGYSSSQYMFDDGGTTTGNGSNDSTPNDDIYSWMISIPDTILSGTHRLNITATDTNSNTNDTEYINITVEDVTVPKVFSVNLSKTQVNATGSDQTTIIANVSDLELETVYADLSGAGGNATQVLSLSSGLYRYTFTVPNSVNNGNYTITINATDNSSNYNDTLSINLTVIDTIPPAITIDSPKNGISYSHKTGLINISTDETANVTYSIDGGSYISLYSNSKNATTNYPSSATWSEGNHTITVNATDQYGHDTNMTYIFYLRPDLNITSVYLANTSKIYTGDTTTINATIATYGFNVSDAIISFYVGGNLISSQNYSSTFNTTSPVTIESTAPWNVTSGTHYFSANITIINSTESDTANNGRLDSITIDDFTLNATNVDFGSINIGGSSVKSLNLTNMAQINQSQITETITIRKTYIFTNNFTRPEKKSFYFAVPVNTTSSDISVTLTYNTSLGNVTYTHPAVADAPGISELVIDVKSMNSSSLDVSATVDIDMNKSNWMTSSFNQTETLENKSSKIITYTLTVPGQIPSGNYTGKMTYSNSNNSVSSNMTFSVNASELWIMSNATEIPVTSPNTTYTLYANKDSGQKDYILEILNKNGGTLTDVNLNFSSLNFTKDNETITITLTNGTDDVIISGKNISFSNIPAETNKSIILKFNVSNHTDGTYSTTFSLTSSDGQPISNYSVNLQLVIDSTLDISMTHSSVAELYPGNTTTFEIDAKYRDGAPVTGLNSSNISALYLKNGASQEDIKLYLNNFTETITPGTYLLNLTLPLSMVGGNLQLGVTLSTGIYSGIYEEGIKVYGQYLSSPVWTSGKAPSNIDIRTFGSGYDTYGISITNNGFRSSGELTATLTTCSSSYLSIVGGQTKTIASIPAGSTGTASWSVDPSTNRSDGCAVTVTVTGGLFWFSQASSSVSKTIDITDTTPATETQDPSEDDEDTPTTLFSSPCDVTMCDYDEKCVNGVCTYFDCNDGYYSDHKCIKYTYAIDFISITENVEIVQGNSSSIRITFNNTGNQDIEDFNFTIEGLDNDSSYRVVTILEDEIVQMETQDIVVLLNISQDAPVGRQNITVWFNSEIHTDSTTFAISILPDEESIAEIDKWMPELERDIIVIKKLFDKRKDRINGTNFTLLNHTMFKIDLLLEEARSAKLAGDFMTVYEKKAQIEDLILQASDILDSGSAKTASIFSRYIIPIVVLIILSAAVYAFYSRIYAGKYSGLKQIQFNPLLMHSKKRGTKPAKYRSTRTADIKRYHHKPSFEIKLQHMLHALKHRINLKLEYMHTHQTKLTNKKFTSQYQFNIPEHIPKQQTKRYHHVKPEINHQNHHPKPKTQNDNPKQKIHDATNSYKRDNPKPSVTNVYKMIEQFEKSKTYCSKCGKNFKTKYELDLHKKYTHK